MDISNQGWGFSLAGLVVGTAVGATGVGGGSLMTPILIMFYGISPALAVGTDLLYASISKSFGVWLHGKNGSVDWRIVGWLSAGSVPATLVTLYLIDGMGHTAELDRLIKLTLSGAIIVTALFTLFQELIASRLRIDRVRGELSPQLQHGLTLLSGLVIGTVVTISSVGAGAIGMMLLLLLYPRHAPVRIVGSDLAHAVLITAIAGIGHARQGSVDYAMLFWLLLGALPGIWIGSRVGFRLEPRRLKQAIAGILIVVGGMTLTKALHGAPKPQQNASSEAR